MVAEVVSTRPQVVRYRLDPKAKWSDGKPLGRRDFAARWQALSGSDRRFAAADTSGCPQMSDVARGADDQEVTVTFATPYADWQRRFDPLLPASLNATPESFATAWPGRVLGNHFFMPNQEGYQDNSGAYGKRDTDRARQLAGGGRLAGQRAGQAPHQGRLANSPTRRAG
ncbi:ABC transporter substrate-binding protein [Streptomyces sp. NPDC020883]|uniref:ABC transporter substrate-binding protein n=1 Tax=Streptomyces sp. NPDC020883 TaxID=3365099 RepID=UPI003792B2BD